LTSDDTAIYHSRRWDEAKLARKRSFSQRSRKGASYSLFFSPWENGYVESFIGKLKDELLNGEIFDTLLEARVVIEDWRREYNQCRPHSSLGYRPPAPEALEVEKFTLEVVH